MLGAQNLQNTLDKIGIWERQPHIRLQELWEWRCRYICMPRLKGPEVLVECVRQAISGLTPGPFAYAARFDEASDKYEGLIIEQGQNAPVAITPDSVIVRADVAETNRPEPGQSENAQAVPHLQAAESRATLDVSDQPSALQETLPTRYFGSATLSSDRPVMDFARLMEGIVEPLVQLMQATVTIRVDIKAEVPQGMTKEHQRILIENARTLKLDASELK